MVETILGIMRTVRSDVPAYVVADFLEGYMKLCQDAVKASKHSQNIAANIAVIAYEDEGMSNYLNGLREEARAKEKLAVDALADFYKEYADLED
ncbi:hypothetical protein [Vibrio phage vB_pir03]|nr:hypothetical protein [Vibrio phage vB_pir03]